MFELFHLIIRDSVLSDRCELLTFTRLFVCLVNVSLVCFTEILGLAITLG